MREVDDPRFFQTIVAAGGLAAAARAMNVTPSAVTQRLQALELKLGVRLLDRGSRKLRLTDEGELFHAESLKITTQYDALIEALHTRQSIVRGHLRILATMGFGRAHVAPAIADFHALHPQVGVTLTLSDRWVDFDEAPFDAVIHVGALPDSSQVAFRIAANRRFLLASPAYVQQHGAPKSPSELTDHACLVLRENDDDVTLWRFIGARKKELSVRVRPVLASNDGEVMKQWAVAGKGIMLRSEWDVARELRDGQLVPLLPNWKLADANIVALVPQRRGLSARTRFFIEFLAARFQPLPPWRTRN
jgi:DNA-binding transcriptional LysR family regulator